MRFLTPGRNRLAAFEHLRYPQPGSLGRSPRQRIPREEAAGRDLAVRLGQPVLAEMPDQIDRDVVAAGDVAVEENSMQGRLFQEFNSPFLRQLARERVAEGFTDFDTAAWQMPARDIAVLDKKHPVVGIPHDAAD